MVKKLKRKDIPKSAIDLSNGSTEQYYAKTTRCGRACYAYFVIVKPMFSTGIEYVRRNVVAYI